MIYEIEKAILNHVKSLDAFKKTYLKDFPDDPKNLQTVIPNGQVLIGYQRSTFDILSESYPITLKRLLQFEISFQLKGLRTHSGIYPSLDAMFFGLLGFIPVQGIQDGMYPVGESFVRMMESIYYYSQSWVVPTIVTEGEDPFIPIDNTSLDVDRVEIGLWVSRIDKVADLDNSQFDRQIIIEKTS